jgi:MarR family 2-MHQ and catechol resistance regulon transcriptional repressor
MSTKFKGSPSQVQALNTFIKLMRGVNAVNTGMEHALATDDLTPSQFGVIETIYHLGPTKPKVLGEKLLKSGANITTVLDNLEKKGLVQRRPAPDDRRSLLIHLTPVGHKKIKKLFPVHATTITHLFSPLTKAEQKELGRLTKKLGLALQVSPYPKE